MNKTLTRIAIAAAFGSLATASFAMTEGEYRTERMRLKESYSYRFVDCNPLSGREKSECASKLRSERDAALDKLEEVYKNSKTQG